MIDRQQRSQLKNLFTSPAWRLVEQLASELVADIKHDDIVCDSEWDTVKKALINEGRARGIKELLEKILNNAQEKDGN